MPPKKQSPEERFFTFIIHCPSGCWMWSGHTNRLGYGTFWDGTKNVRAHRWAYEYFISPIPEGLVCDHIVCDTPGCVNPNHLKITTNIENVTRSQKWTGNKKYCPQGHPYSGKNLRVINHKDGYKNRHCRICERDALRRRQAKIRKEYGLSEWTYYKRKRNGELKV